MHLVVLILVVCVEVKCEHFLVSLVENNKLKNLQKRSLRTHGIEFCNIGCVLYDPVQTQLIDDPGRNLYNSFSVISTSYVIEVIGGPHGLSGHPLRVMISDKVLGTKHAKTSTRLQDALILEEVEMIQRITFNLHTNIAINAHSRAPEEFDVRIGHVVPHVIFLHNYKLEHRGEIVSGVVTIEACNLPMMLELVVGRLENGRCWMKPLDRTTFEDYITAVRIRGNDRHVIGMISTIVETLMENEFPFDAYMEEVNEFAFRFLKETLLQTKRVIKENKRFIELCKTISRDIPQSERATSTVEPKDCKRGSGVILFSVELRSKNKSQTKRNDTTCRDQK